MEKILVGFQAVEKDQHELTVMAAPIPGRDEHRKIMTELENFRFQFDSVDADSIRASLCGDYDQVWKAAKQLIELGWDWNV